MQTKDIHANENNTPFWKSISVFLLKIGIAAGLVFFLIYHTDALSQFKKLNFHSFNFFWIGMACLLYAIHLFVNAWRWHLLLKYQNLPCSLFEACSLTCQSFFFSLAMPGGAIGGDVIRGGFLSVRFPKGSKFDGVFTIIMDRFTGMIGIFLMAFLVLFLAQESIPEEDATAQFFTKLLLAISAFGLIAALGILFHKKLERLSLFCTLEKIGNYISRGFLGKMLHALDTYENAKKEISICIVASIIGVNVVLGLCFYCVCLACDASLFAPLLLPIMTAITVGNIAGLIPATPSGVGMRDYFVLALLQATLEHRHLEYPPGPMIPTLLMTMVLIGMCLLCGVFFLFDHAKPSCPIQKRNLNE